MGEVVRHPRAGGDGDVMFSVSPAVAVLIVTVARHERVTAGELLARLTVDKANAIGLKHLAREVSRLAGDGPSP